jgi:hypothetical protein
MTRNAHQGVCPVSASASIMEAVSGAGRKVKSLFTQSTSKRKVDESIQSATPASKQLATVAPASVTL